MLAEADTVAVSNVAQPGGPSPVDSARRVRAVLFDLDGTLYRQTPMRAFMALELAALGLTRPQQAPVSWRVLSEFRRSQETLRHSGGPAGPAEQLELTARHT